LTALSISAKNAACRDARAYNSRRYDNEEILRELSKGHTEDIRKMGIDALALQTCLIQKGVISEAELKAAKDQVERDLKELLSQAQKKKS
jgi:hypothetical protein